MEKKEVYFLIKAKASHVNYMFNPNTNEFDRDDCILDWDNYKFKSLEHAIYNFRDVNPMEFKNSLNGYITISKYTDTFTREEVEDDWEFDECIEEELMVLGIYELLKDNCLI